MRIVCPKCDTGYEIKPEALGANGRTVRCASCANTWFAIPEHVAEPAAQPDVLPPLPEMEPPMADPSDVMGDRNAEAATGAADAHGGATLVHDVESRASRSLRKSKSTKGNKSAKAGRDRTPGRPPNTGFLILGGIALSLIGALVFRDAVVRLVPDTAGLFAAVGLPVNLRGLEFRDIAASIEFEAGQPVTVVEGRIENITEVSMAVPRLRLAVRAVDGREVMSWAASAARPTVGPRESVPFRTRLTAPVRDGTDIEVRFLAQRDTRTGAPR
jgi:predicted Zn finger-like uncharacterized protein